MASHAPASSTAALPITTIYIKNLNSKINKKELRRSLYAYFSAYGQVLDVIALKTKALHGQAWIVYGDHASAKAAMRDAAAKSIFGKPMVIDWAKTVSKAAKAAHGLHPDQAVKAVDPHAPEGEQEGEAPNAQKRAFDEMNDGDEDDEGEDIEMDDDGEGGQSTQKRARLHA